MSVVHRFCRAVRWSERVNGQPPRWKRGAKLQSNRGLGQEAVREIPEVTGGWGGGDEQELGGSRCDRVAASRNQAEPKKALVVRGMYMMVREIRKKQQTRN